MLNPPASIQRVGDSKAACDPKLPDATSPKSDASPVVAIVKKSIVLSKVDESIPCAETTLTPLDTAPMSLAACVKSPKSVEFD